MAVSDALDLYDRGAYVEFVTSIEADGALVDVYPRFERAAEQWIATGDLAARERRRLIAATVALEVAQRLRDEPLRIPAEYLIWACRLMREYRPVSPNEQERLWYLASVAGIGALSSAYAGSLLGGYDDSVGLLPFEKGLGPDGQAGNALRRFPEEPRFQLIRVVSRTLRETPSRPPPSMIELAARHVRDPAPPRPQTKEGLPLGLLRNHSVELLSGLGRVPDHVAALEALEKHESLRAEAAMHVAWLLGSTMQIATAIERLQRVPALTSDPNLRYVSYYLLGKTFLNAGERGNAIEAFEDAVRLVPNARAASTHLAALLMLSDRNEDRERAYELLQRAYSDQAPPDPWRDFRRAADSGRWPVIMAQLRQALLTN